MSARAGRLSPKTIMKRYATGDEHDWWEESLHLWLTQGVGMAALAFDIETNGVREPVLLGNDGRVWDGHHRIIIAAGFGLDDIPVERAQ